jgi:putative iron-dependent peroxidase
MRMIDRMFIGDPPGFYDKILDVSTAVTGSTFFVPSNPVLQALADPDALADVLGIAVTDDDRSGAHSGESSASAGDGTAGDGAPGDGLGIGSLRATPRDPTDLARKERRP